MYIVLVKPLMQKYHTVTVLKWTFLMGLPLILPFGMKDAIDLDWSAIPSDIYYKAGFVIVFTTFVAYLLNTLALKELSPSVVSAYIYTQPLLTALISIYYFHINTLTLEKVFSAAMIFIGVYMVSIPSKKPS